VLQVCRRGWLKGKEVLPPAQVIVNDLDQGKGQSSNSQNSSDHDESAKTKIRNTQDSGTLQAWPRGPVLGDAV